MNWIEAAMAHGEFGHGGGRPHRKASGDLRAVLAQFSEMIKASGQKTPAGFAYATAYDYFLENGREFESAPLAPAELGALKAAIANHRAMYKKKLCYYNAQLIAQGNRACRYVEGYMMSQGIPIPIEHAWNSINGKVVDFTMAHANGGKPILGEIPAGWEYFGAELPTSMIRMMWSRHGVSTPLVTNHQDGFPLLRNGPPKKKPADAPADGVGKDDVDGSSGEG
jgi:hypothetical protein